MNVEPSLSYLSERVLNNFFKSAYPTLLTSVEFNLGDARGLNLFEFFNSEGLAFD